MCQARAHQQSDGGQGSQHEVPNCQLPRGREAGTTSVVGACTEQEGPQSVIRYAVAHRPNDNAAPRELAQLTFRQRPRSGA